MIEYRDTLDRLTPDSLGEFFADWPDRPDNVTFLKSLKGCHVVWLAFENDTVIALISAISDGSHTACTTYFEVLEKYRGQGIAKELMRRLEESLDGHYAIVLQCGEDVVPFYGKLGFKRGTGNV